MATLDDLVSAMSEARVRFNLSETAIQRAVAFDPDAVLFPPLLALTTLLVASARKDLRAAEAPVWTAASLTEHFVGLGTLAPKLERSVAVRGRCADALVFLENANLVEVGPEPDRIVSCTSAGSRFVRDAKKRLDDLGLLARGLAKAHTTVTAKGLRLW